MIKAIVLLLVGATFLGLLNQSNSNRVCPSMWHDCMGRRNGMERVYASICVPYKWDKGLCKVEMAESEIIAQCKKKNRNSLEFTRQVPLNARCWLGIF